MSKMNHVDRSAQWLCPSHQSNSIKMRLAVIALLSVALGTVTHGLAEPPNPAVAAGSSTTASGAQTTNDRPDVHDKRDATFPTIDPQTATRAQNIASAWTMLTAAATDPRHLDRRVEAMGIVGTLGAAPQAEVLLRKGFADPELEVRVAAILAAGGVGAGANLSEPGRSADKTGDPRLFADIRRLLNDKEPQVAYTAAMTLARHNDLTGEEILLAVVDGDRPSSAGLVSGAMHTVHNDLHSPEALAKMGAIQGLSMLPGPFGIGVGAYEFMHKSGGSSARAAAVEVLSQQRTQVVRKALVAALMDKDATVRSAASIALSRYHEADVAAQIAGLFDDPKLPVRLSAAAGFLVATRAAPGPRSYLRTTRDGQSERSRER